MLDKTQGVGHFNIEDKRAIELVEYMKRKLPGYLVPKLVREQAGAAFKQMII
jgi:L-lysine 2,3-aminomutase